MPSPIFFVISLIIRVAFGILGGFYIVPIYINESLSGTLLIIIHVIAIIVLLIVALVFILQSQARKRGQTISEYVRKSIAISPNLEATPPTQVQLQPTSSIQDLEAPTGTNEPTGITNDEAEAPLTSESIVPTVATTPPPTTTTTTTPALPDGWEINSDPDNGNQYYYNTQTGASQWEAP